MWHRGVGGCRTFFRKWTVCGFLRKSLHCSVHKCISRSYQTVPWYFYLPYNVQTVLSRHFIQSVLCVIGPDSCNCNSYIQRHLVLCAVYFFSIYRKRPLGLVFKYFTVLPSSAVASTVFPKRPGSNPGLLQCLALAVRHSIPLSYRSHYTFRL